MSVLERNKYWLEQKNMKLQAQRKIAAEVEMRECTFMPAFYARVPQLYQKFSYSKVKQRDSRIMGSCSLLSSRFEPDMTIISVVNEYHPISPYQVPLANPRYKGIADCVSQTLKAEGIGGFYKGFVPCILRAFPANGATFLAFEMTMRLISSPK